MLGAYYSNSIVSGSGIASFHAGTTVSIIVRAKDTYGNYITTGGDKFIVKISNPWTKYNSFYWKLTGSSGALSSNINAVMTDYNNGTYSYNYSVSTAGIINLY